MHFSLLLLAAFLSAKTLAEPQFNSRSFRFGDVEDFDASHLRRRSGTGGGSGGPVIPPSTPQPQNPPAVGPGGRPVRGGKPAQSYRESPLSPNPPARVVKPEDKKTSTISGGEKQVTIGTTKAADIMRKGNLVGKYPSFPELNRPLAIDAFEQKYKSKVLMYLQMDEPADFTTWDIEITPEPEMGDSGSGASTPTKPKTTDPDDLSDALGGLTISSGPTEPIEYNSMCLPPSTLLTPALYCFANTVLFLFP